MKRSASVRRCFAAARLMWPASARSFIKIYELLSASVRACACARLAAAAAAAGFLLRAYSAGMQARACTRKHRALRAERAVVRSLSAWRSFRLLLRPSETQRRPIYGSNSIQFVTLIITHYAMYTACMHRALRFASACAASAYWNQPKMFASLRFFFYSGDEWSLLWDIHI